jgi:hypothetical protein
LRKDNSLPSLSQIKASIEKLQKRARHRCPHVASAACAKLTP